MGQQKQKTGTCPTCKREIRSWKNRVPRHGHIKKYGAFWTPPCQGSGERPKGPQQEDLFIKRRWFAGRKYKIPHGSIVIVFKFYAKGRAVVEYDGEKILTMTRLLRKKEIK